MLTVTKDGNYKLPRPKKLVKDARLERYYPQRLVIKQKKHTEDKENKKGGLRPSFFYVK